MTPDSTFAALQRLRSSAEDKEVEHRADDGVKEAQDHAHHDEWVGAVVGAAGIVEAIIGGRGTADDPLS